MIASDADWHLALQLNWPQNWFYITELGATPLTQHQRLMVCFVGGQVETMQFPFAYPPRPVAARYRLSAPLDRQRLSIIFKSLYRRIPLDYWSTELAILPSGDFRLEHLWVGLPFADDAPPNKPTAALWAKVAQTLDTLIRTPTKWRHSLEKAANAVRIQH